jgi:ABC-type branched-subunit amino acid transport system substrate-binding protein
MPVARSQKLDDGGGQNRIFRTAPNPNVIRLTNDSILNWPNRR